MSDSVENRADPRHPGGERPHGVSCPGCRAEQVCNQCGERTTMMAGRCTNGRCRNCCLKVCRHRQSELG